MGKEDGVLSENRKGVRDGSFPKVQVRVLTFETSLGTSGLVVWGYKVNEDSLPSTSEFFQVLTDPRYQV